jgi:hypothetical protein
MLKSNPGITLYFVLISLLTLSPFISRAEESISRYRFETPIGIGSLVGSASGKNEYAAVLEGQNHFNQRPSLYQMSQYGHGQSRLEVGNKIGITLSSQSGVTLIGLNKNRKYFSPHLGIEAASGRITFDSNGTMASYYEWIPMVSGGFQIQSGPCRILPLVKGGGALGNIVQNGIAPALGYSYGASSYLNCQNIDFSADYIRVESAGRGINLGIVDLSYNFAPVGFRIGLRGESEISSLSSPGSMESGSREKSRNETRFLLVFRTRISD